MRRLLMLSMFTVLPAIALAQTSKLPPDLQPIPEPPPMPAGVVDQDQEPDITINQRNGNKEEEYRLGGKLYMVKVTPPHGTPYYLVDEQGNGVMTRMNTLTSGTRPPMWVIKTW